MAKEQKIKAVEELKQMIENHSAICILDMHKLSSKQLQEIRKKIRGKALIRMTKKSILMRSIENAKKEGLKQLENVIPQQPAIIFTNDAPFKFYGLVDKMKSPAAAKGGDIAPRDIKVAAGPTNLLPGPVISELTRVGIPAGVEDGKIAVKAEKTVVRAGEVISDNLASALRKLNIQPMEIGVNIVAIFENGMIYKKDVLSLIGDAYVNKLKQAFNEALNLSVSVYYTTKDNIQYLLSKAFHNAKAIEAKLGVKPEVVQEAKPDSTVSGSEEKKDGGAE